MSLRSRLADFWLEFKATKIGPVGLVLLAALIAMTVIPWFTLDVTTYTSWSYHPMWELNPKLAPPEWINLFSEKKYTPKQVLKPVAIEPLHVYMAERLAPQLNMSVEELAQYLKEMFVGYAYKFRYDYEWDIPTKDIVVIIRGLNHSVKVSIDVVRPPQPGVDEEDRYLDDVIRGTYAPVRELVTGEINIKVRFSSLEEKQQLLRAIKLNLIKKYEPDVPLHEVTASTVDPITLLFLQAGPGMHIAKTPPLKGVYTFVVKLEGEFEKPPEVELVIVGSCYGVLGTDAHGRDIFVGILWGSHIALMMGLAYAFAVTMIGLVYGTISGYFGGRVDAVMQRIVEIMYSIPGFAFVILLVYMFRELYGEVNIWIIIVVYIIFGWPYVSMVIRSMAMQIREQPYIEAAIAVGASHSRIIFRHVMPQILPYAFAVMVLTIPNAIMIEAALNVLGLGNPYIPTWGRLLASAIDEGVITAWWWYIPPGLMIALTGVTFIFIGNALETVVNPRLRRF